MRLNLLIGLLAMPMGFAVAQGQDLPAYVPVNPVLASRSALYAQPLVAPATGWRHAIVADYSNAVERTSSSNGRSYIFDAETLQLDLWLGRDLSPSSFVFADVAIRGGYAGGLDPFLNWYHDLIGLRVPARNERPENTFDWAFELPDGDVVRERPGTFLGDLRLGAGTRIGRGQLVATITLPTTSTDLDGWGRGTVGTALAYTTNLFHTSRIDLEGGVSAGWTPTHGLLAAYQQSTFIGGMGAMRWRALGKQVLFATLWMQSANWKDTGFTALETAEVTLDFGAMLRLKEGWPTVQVGMTEDLVPRGPAVDAGFKLGLHW
jgi:hypothetical protein